MKAKKAEFNMLNSMLISFIGFILVSIMVIIVIANINTTTLICPTDSGGAPTRVSSTGTCQACPSSLWIFNTTGNICCNASTGLGAGCTAAGNQTAIVDYWGSSSYNASKNLMSAAILPPQFASIIVIVVVIVGILSLLALIGYNVYQKMQ